MSTPNIETAESSKFKKALRLVSVFAASFLFRLPEFFMYGMVFFTFHDRDISRAQALLDGKMIFFGPELTGGGNLPGPFYYFLLSVPVGLGFGWMGTYYWMFILMALAGTCGWYFMRSRFDVVTASIWLILYSFLEPIYQLVNKLVNPSFSILFLLLANIFTVKAFTDEKLESRNRSVLISFFLCALIIQTHYSGITNLFALLFLLFTAKKFNLPKPGIKKILQGISVFLLTISPYLIWQIFAKFNIYLGQPQSYVGSTVGSLPSLFAYFKISTSVSQFIILCLQKLFLVIPVVLIIGFVLKFTLFKKADFEKAVVSRPDHSALLKILMVISAFNFIPYSFYFYVPQGARYGAPFAITFSFLVAVIINKFLNSEDKWKKFNYVGIVAFLVLLGTTISWGMYKIPVFTQYYYGATAVLLLLAAALYGFKKKHVIPLISFLLIGLITQTQGLLQIKLARGIHAEQNMPVYWHWKAIWTRIYKMTGWTADEAIDRIYFINHQREQSPRRSYEYMVKGLTYKPNGEKPDGFFVSIDKDPGLDLKEWMLQQPIQKEVKDALIANDIVIGKYDKNARIAVAPFYIKDKIKLPAYFHTAGWGYPALPEADILQKIKEPSGAIKLDNSRYVFKWNDCPDHHIFCDAGMIVDIGVAEKGQYSIDLLAVGLAHSQSSKWISPTWTQAWINPYIEITCGNETKKFLVATSVGYNRAYVESDKYFQFPMINNSFLLPLKRHFELTCSQGLGEITAGFDSSLVEREYDSVSIPGGKLTLKVQ